MTHPPEWIALAAPASGLLTMTLLHVAACQFGGISAHLVRFVITFVAGLGVTIAVTALADTAGPASIADRLGLLAMNAGAFAGLGYGYFTFVNLTATSLRLRLLRELLRASGQRMPTAHLLALYAPEQIVDARIDRLVGWGQLRRADGRFCVDGKPWFLRIARAVHAWRWVVFGKHGTPQACQPGRPETTPDRPAHPRRAERS